MKDFVSRRQFLGTSAVAVAGLALPSQLLGAKKKSLLVFTKSSGFEHQVVKRVDGHPSILEDAVTALGKQHGFDVTTTKDGQIFDSKDFHKYAAVLFYTTGDLTKAGTDNNPPMSPQGKKALLDAVHGGLGFVGVHAAATRSIPSLTLPITPIGILRTANNLIPTFECWAGSSSSTEALPGLQAANLIVKDPKFPGLEGVTSPVSLTEEWYSLKDFMPDLHVILTLDTQGMKGEPYQRAPYPVTWARMDGKGRVFFTAIGDRPENWSNPFFLNLLTGGIRWSMR